MKVADLIDLLKDLPSHLEVEAFDGSLAPDGEFYWWNAKVTGVIVNSNNTVLIKTGDE